MGTDHLNERRAGLKRLGDVIYGADRELSAWAAKRIPGYFATHGATALGVVRDEELAAAVIYERFNGVHCEVTIVVAQRATWANRRTLFALFDYPYRQLGCLALSATIPASNLQSLNLCAKLGFEAVALVKFAAHDGGALVVMQQERKNCRWLDYGQGQQGTGGTGPIPDGEC